MVFNANDLSNWQNFPKGLKVLLLLGGGGDGDGDGFSAAETRSKLESMDYIVTTFTDEAEALAAVLENPESFHVAIVEVNTRAENESFKFLEAAKDHLPTIMVSTDHCITTSMKCIALGAVEFLQKPLSPEKLKNIWQHVVHKAFNDGGSSVADSLQLFKETDVPMLDIDTDMTTDENDTAPSTPQITQVCRLPNVDCSMENVNSSTERENTEDHDIGESQLADTTNRELDDNRVVVKEEKEDTEKEAEKSESGDVKSEKTDMTNCHMTENNTSSNNQSSGGIKNLSGTKTTRKKIDWTQELHKKFVQAVEHLGIDQAIPSRILEFMKVDGLTRHNVASHLQKYRMHRRNILPKEEHNHRWIQTRDSHRPIQRSYNGYPPQHRPVMAYPVWGVPGVHPQGTVQTLWPPQLPQLLSSGQPPQWHWKQPYPTVNGHTPTWGCPVGQAATGTYCAPNIPGGFQYPAGAETGYKSMPDDEMLDEAVQEAMTKPWLPLPIGLKSPTAESVLTELTRQGIATVHNSSNSSSLINGSHRLR